MKEKQTRAEGNKISIFLNQSQKGITNQIRGWKIRKKKKETYRVL